MNEAKLFSLENKIAVVTGGAGLLGKHFCKALSGAGANVVVCDINKDEPERFADELRPRSIGVQADITDADQIKNLKERILKEFGRIDILVNNAAINDMFENQSLAAELSMFENYPLDMWQKSLDVNITGMFLCSQILGSQMAKAGKGSIINIASTYGVVAPDQSIYKKKDGSQSFYKSAAYPVTKGAVISFTKFLASYWGNKGVRVNALSPGGVENNQEEYFISNYSAKTILGRMAKPSDYEGVIIFLASDASNYMTGANLIVDGGWTAW
jgi:NAD(P)-dependent dehydrogenase (short-subunit alcohol dehydrogenase family)